MNEIEQQLRGLAGADANARSIRAADRTVARAMAEGVADVWFTSIESPVGELLAAGTRRGLVALAYEDGEREAVLTGLASRLSPRMVEAGPALDDVRRQLEEYFDGRRRRFELPLDWTLAPGFRGRILHATAAVPYGQVTTYAQVAARAGSPRAFRAAGNALGANPMPIVVPCHRVLRAGDHLGGYTGGLGRKRYLLGIEGALEPSPLDSPAASHRR
jgi:methylated-DNA-[protein]-cysteine S-methyltransferase